VDLQELTESFYIRTLSALTSSGASFLVGGAYALAHYTGIQRHTKDFDIFVRRDDYEAVMRILGASGCETELTYPHWLGKAKCAHGMVDVIFSSGNGVAVVDDLWFEHAARGTVFGFDVALCPPEEMIWSKAFIQERERYDGADILHLILARAEKLDWDRLLERFERHWRVLFTCLCLFGFVYPSERARIPRAVMTRLLQRMQEELDAPPPQERICRGTLVSREQYLIDIERWGFLDARLGADVSMTQNDIAHWTRAIGTKE
jgi:hypothetical protein